MMSLFTDDRHAILALISMIASGALKHSGFCRFFIKSDELSAYIDKLQPGTIEDDDLRIVVESLGALLRIAKDFRR